MLADVGIPMIVVQWPLMIGALIPVIMVEALLIRRWVQLSFRDAFIGVTKANLLSTLAGFPLAWLAMFAIEMAVMLPLGVAAFVDAWASRAGESGGGPPQSKTLRVRGGCGSEAAAAG